MRACMLFQGVAPHPAHETFAAGVDADLIHFETGRPPGPGTDQNTGSILDRIRTGLRVGDRYDVVIAEGTAPLQTLLVLRTRCDVDALYLAADETFYTLRGRRSRGLWRVVSPLANQLLDGVIAVGRDAYAWAKPYIGDLPVEYVRPPIADEKFDRLAALDPTGELHGPTVVSVGEARESNNHALLVEATRQLSGRWEDVRTILLGAGHSEMPYADAPHVVTPGFVGLDEFATHLGRADVYVQPSIADAFPVASLEAMLSATPTVVTSTVGVRELLPDSHVSETTPDAVAAAVERLLDAAPSRRRDLGLDHRRAVVELTESNQQRLFREAVLSLR